MHFLLGYGYPISFHLYGANVAFEQHIAARIHELACKKASIRHFSSPEIVNGVVGRSGPMLFLVGPT